MHLARIEQAAQSGVWTASAWWLERRYPRTWGRPEVQLAYQERDEIEARLKALEQRVGEQAANVQRVAHTNGANGRWHT